METNPASILIIDDQPANLKVLLSFLKKHGFDVRIAENGIRALQVLENYLPEIILLDVMMPGLDGFATCERIKNNEKTALIPIIFMTALDSVEDKIAGFEAGGVDYVTKPFQQIEVLARISTHLTLQRQRLTLIKQREELKQALAEINKLSGILPICSVCKKIRNDAGYWQQVEHYIAEHSEAVFSHALCVECADKLYGDEKWYQEKHDEIIKKNE